MGMRYVLHVKSVWECKYGFGWDRPAPGIFYQPISLSQKTKWDLPHRLCGLNRHEIKGSLKMDHDSHHSRSLSLSGEHHSYGPFSRTWDLIIMQSACWDAVHVPTVERPELAGAGNEKQTEQEANMTRCRSWKVRQPHLRWIIHTLLMVLQSIFKIRPVQT